MNASNARRPVRVLIGTAAAAGLCLAATVAPAQAQTREHIFLARTSLSVDASGTSSTAEVCTDWTNEDGTHGTNCPEPSGWDGTGYFMKYVGYF